MPRVHSAPAAPAVCVYASPRPPAPEEGSGRRHRQPTGRRARKHQPTTKDRQMVQRLRAVSMGGADSSVVGSFSSVYAQRHKFGKLSLTTKNIQQT